MRRIIRAGRLAAMRPMEPATVERDCWILIENGLISAVTSDRGDFDAEVIDWRDRLVLPGLVNAHTHLELSHHRPPADQPGHLAQWLLGVRPTTAEQAAQSASAGAAESLAFGVTTMGDITAFPDATRAALLGNTPRRGASRGSVGTPESAASAAASVRSLNVVSFGEVRAMATRRDKINHQLPAAVADGGAVSPHAPYSVEPQNYRRCLAAAEKRSVPLATHLAETREEADFLSDHTGPFRELWETIGGWDDDVPTFDGSPVALAKHLGLLDAAVPVVLAHGNYLEPGDIDLLAAGRASVAYCPRTHAYFGHDPHPLVELLARGVNVCLGTDSRASSPDLDLLAEVRHVHDHRPDVDISTLWSMATWRGAEALGLTGVAGSVAPGCRADLLALPDPSGDAPLATVLQDIEHRTVLCSEVEPLRLSR